MKIIAWLIANIRMVAIASLATACFGSGWYVRGEYDASRLKSQLMEQERAIVAQCEADKKLTSEVSNEYQKKITVLNRRVGELKRLHSAVCVPIAGTPGGHDAAEGAGKLPRPHGIAAGPLYDFGDDAEQVGLRLDACQDFVRRVWKKKAPGG
jgi:hypothetical protein